MPLRLDGVVNFDHFRPSAESEARILLLINAFSGQREGLQGRTKLAKLDFLLRYPEFLERALVHKGVPATEAGEVTTERNPIEQRMVRFRYGPWDPSYFALLGALIGRGLIEITPYNRGLGYRATPTGRALANRLSNEPAFQQLDQRTALLKRHFNQTGTTLKKFVYDLFPEVAGAPWQAKL